MNFVATTIPSAACTKTAIIQHFKVASIFPFGKSRVWHFNCVNFYDIKLKVSLAFALFPKYHCFIHVNVKWFDWNWSADYIDRFVCVRVFLLNNVKYNEDCCCADNYESYLITWDWSTSNLFIVHFEYCFNFLNGLFSKYGMLKMDFHFVNCHFYGKL